MSNGMKGRSLVYVMLVCLAMSQAVFAQKCLSGDCYDGYSVCEYPSGARYEGYFKRGVINGKGTLYFSNGNQYTGDFKNQYREGQGRLNFANGDVYTGSFVKGKLEGKGTLHYVSGDVYIGDWLNNQNHGNGTYTYKDGNKYEGSFVNGKMEGFGKMYYTDGAVFAGNWRDSQKNGFGTLTKANGKSWKGEWQDGKFAVEQTASEEKSKIKPIETSKVGEYTYLDGSKWIGTMKNGEPEGKGTCYYADGDKYTGGWKSHSPHGEGVIFYRDGRVLAAVWEYGRYVSSREEAQPVLVQNKPVATEAVANKSVKIWAVVVGVASYPHMPPLKFTDDDANRYYTFLKSPEGGALPDEQVALLLDESATNASILATMKNMYAKADENDVIVFYFSGHGIDGAFIPYDFDGYTNQLLHEDVKEILTSSKAKHKVCIADACHSGSLWAAKGYTASEQSAIDKYYKAFVNSKGGIAFLMSSKSGENSLEDHGLRSGIFSHFLIKGMKGAADLNMDRIISVQEIYAYTYTQVKEYTLNQQSPTLHGTFDRNMPVAVCVR